MISPVVFENVSFYLDNAFFNLTLSSTITKILYNSLKQFYAVAWCGNVGCPHSLTYSEVKHQPVSLAPGRVTTSPPGSLKTNPCHIYMCLKPYPPYSKKPTKNILQANDFSC